MNNANCKEGCAALSSYRVRAGKDLRIAISGRSGCGNTTVSRIVAEALGIAQINYTFRNIAEEKGIPLEAIVEQAKLDTSFDKLVDSRQVALARVASCVLGSRLAIWMLPEADLKVYLSASLEVRSKRIYNREGGNIEEVQRFTEKRDSEDSRRYMTLYGIDNANYSTADLIIDTEKYLPQEIAKIILDALLERGLVEKD